MVAAAPAVVAASPVIIAFIGEPELFGLWIEDGPALVVLLGPLACQVGRQVQTLVRLALNVGKDGVGCPDAARSLLPDTVGRLAGVLAELRTRSHRQAVLHLVGRQVRVLTEHQGGDAGDHSRRHGGARHFEVMTANLVVGVLAAQVGVLPHQRDDVGAGRDQIGFDKSVQRRAGGGEGRDVVVAEIFGRVVVGEGADGDDVGSVARHPNAERRRATIAGAGDHHDARLPGRHRRQVVRIGPVGRDRHGVHRDVEHADVVRVLVLHDPVNPLKHVRIGAHPRLVEHAHGHQVGRWRDAPVLTVPLLVHAVAHNARDVGAVAVGILRRPAQMPSLVQLPGHHVVVSQDAVGVAIWRSAQAGEGGVNPGVEESHSDACPQVAGVPYLFGPDGLGELHVDWVACRLHRTVERHADYTGGLGQAIQRVLGYLGHDCVDDADLGRDTTAVGAHGRRRIFDAGALYDDTH